MGALDGPVEGKVRMPLGSRAEILRPGDVYCRPACQAARFSVLVVDSVPTVGCALQNSWSSCLGELSNAATVPTDVEVIRGLVPCRWNSIRAEGRVLSVCAELFSHASWSRESCDTGHLGPSPSAPSGRELERSPVGRGPRGTLMYFENSLRWLLIMMNFSRSSVPSFFLLLYVHFIA